MDLKSADVISGVVGNAVFAAAIYALRKFRGQLERTNAWTRRGLWAAVLVAFVGANYLLLVDLSAVKRMLVVGGSTVLCIAVWLELWQFWRLGIIGADKTIKGGIDFGASLRLCKNSLDFLGVGAAKLVACREDFEKAVRRCQRQDRPVRFLLSAPDNAELDNVARRARRGPAEYQQTVRSALEVLARLKVEHALNIEVRLYQELPLFRLMFIDDTLCLASHYVFSEGDGSQLAQLHLRRFVGQARDVDSVYYPFRLYFESLWKKATECDYQTFLK